MNRTRYIKIVSSHICNVDPQNTLLFATLLWVRFGVEKAHEYLQIMSPTWTLELTLHLFHQSALLGRTEDGCVYAEIREAENCVHCEASGMTPTGTCGACGGKGWLLK